MVFVITLTIIVDRAIYEPHLPDHFAYLAALKERGALLLSGPFTDKRGGMLIISADSVEEARAIAQADPLVARGLDRYELREWRITDGCIDRIAIERPSMA
ncbi:MAG: hypothetical protein KatS3mg057_2583 [Herpetosiphonaceae bacterium]|nr:MAG: hypothetical protein KatS3mg057_2583 [Herpetosiphonaceae bacterium]